MLSHHDVLALPLSTVVYPAEHPLAGETGIVNAFALRHPAGIILVDTGVGEGSAEIDQWYQPVRRPLKAELAAHGIEIGDVAILINTHLHFDHCGQNRLFPGVPIHVQAVEYEAGQRPDFTIVEWVVFPGATYRLLDGEAEIVPGVRVIPTPGHTPGHQSMVIDTAEGVVLLAGQAVQSLADYRALVRTGELPDGSDAPDVAACRASARRLLGFGATRVWFSHDEGIWQTSELTCGARH